MSAPLIDIGVEETVGSPGIPRRLYAYTLPGKSSERWTRNVGSSRVKGTGLIKIGETSRASAAVRVQEQLQQAYPGLRGVTVYFDEPAVRKDGTVFRDGDVHRVLTEAGIRRVEGEWFATTIDEIKAALVAVRNGKRFHSERTADWTMRPEQERAVSLTAGYFIAKQQQDSGRAPKFLWNAKMRFGKTFTAYQLARELGWKRVLVLTYKPAVQSAWRDDLLSHVDFEDWHFVDRDTPSDRQMELADGDSPLAWFASFQDLAGKTPDGEIKQHNELLYLIDWDCIVIDEYHFGAWRDNARDLYDPADKSLAESEEPDEQVTGDDLGLKAAHYLYLSGTPFRAITNGEFTEDQVFNWTYPQEQEAKASWANPDRPNPYIDLPGMEMYCYRIGEEAANWAGDGEFDGFSLNEYFKAKKTDGAHGYEFEDPGRVSEFLNMLRGKLSDQMKMEIVAGQKAPFPYESPVFSDAIRHAVWYMPDVGSCVAMRDMLSKHPAFRDYEVVVAAGNHVGAGADAKPPVLDAIEAADHESRSGSVTLSCGKLMTGVTVAPWGAILMLRSLKAPESYFQAAFRVQSPWSDPMPNGERRVLKPTCYVFEFDPNRALQLVAEYGIRLASSGDTTASQTIGQLLNHLPIYGFEGGAMSRLDAEAVLEWATAGIGATALAQRWNSPLLVDVNERTISAVLAHPELLATLEQIEDFRALVHNGPQVVTSTKLLKKAKREQGGKLNPAQRREQSETAKRRKEIRGKLQKFLAKIPVFMYVTDVREEALKHVIESIDTDLFERVTGLTVSDFRLLSDLGLFNANHMDAAIWQFRSFELASLMYAESEAPQDARRVGLWETTTQVV